MGRTEKEETEELEEEYQEGQAQVAVRQAAVRERRARQHHGTDQALQDGSRPVNKERLLNVSKRFYMDWKKNFASKTFIERFYMVWTKTFV